MIRKLFLPCSAAALMCIVVCAPAPALAQFFPYDGPKLVGSGAIGNAVQGYSVALSGDGSTVIVGGPHDNSNLGATWVFRRSVVGSVQQDKLVGGGNVGIGFQGASVAISADGNTAVVGGPSDNNDMGAAWVFTRSAGTWTQQAELIGSGAIGNAQQGLSVGLSGDGNTAIIGGFLDNNGVGAAWVFTRSGTTWSQQQKLVATGAIGNASQGWSVALSADSGTALIGGYTDNSSLGAAWVFTRSGANWSQQQKLVGTGASADAQQGRAVALSADGNTAIVGGINDNNQTGAAWVFTRGNGGWSQQGPKLVANDAVGIAQQGYSVALSADGNTALMGGRADNNNAGAAWVFKRSSGTWTQLGAKLVGTGTVGTAVQGTSVALSADGNTAAVGGPDDNSGAGAVWKWVQFFNSNMINPAATHDLSGDFDSDIVWRHSSGTTAAWLMAAAQVLQAGNFGVVPTSWQIVGQRDFNNDGKYDLLWRDTSTGTVAIWLMRGLTVLQTGTLGAVASNWIVAGTSDFNYDGDGDILWYDGSTGAVAIWLMQGLSIMQNATLGVVPGNWKLVATDRKGNIFWRDANTGTLVIWEMYGVEVVQSTNLGAVPTNWVIAAVGDFDGNGSTDILWRDGSTGTVAIWLLNGYSVVQTGTLGTVPGNWSIVDTGDFDDNRMSDILWRDTASGAVAIWFMNGLQVASAVNVATVGTDWTIQGLNAD